jgi:hypothetical protein
MTQLDATDNKVTATPTNDATGSFHAEYQNTFQGGDTKIVKVADDQAAPAGGDDPQGGSGKVGVKELIGADPKELSPNLKTLQGLAGHFDKADDKTKAMGEVKAEVEKTIGAADANEAVVEKQATADMGTLKPKLDAVEASLKAAVGPLQAALGKVPEADQKHVAAELQLMTDDKTSPALKKAIETDLASHAGLVPAANAFMAAEKAAEPSVKQYEALKAKVGEAAEEPVVARMVYADMLEQSGDKAGAKQAQAEAMALQMGMSIDDFHKLQQQQKTPGK